MAAGLLAVGARAAEPPAGLALALEAEGRPLDAAVEFRRLALEATEPEAAGNWTWWAAREYARAGAVELSNRMLDRTEDAVPFGLAGPVAWLRAENALRERDYPAAAFHFDSLKLKVEGGDWQAYAARGAAAAHLREGDGAAAQVALKGAPGTEHARAAVEQYAGRRDKKPWLGGVLGLVPGLGYAYSGEYANAARSLILNSLFIWGMVEAADHEEWGVFAVVGFGELTWYSGSIYGGIDAAHRHNQRRLDLAVDDVRGAARPEADKSQIPLVVLGFSF